PSDVLLQGQGCGNPSPLLAAQTTHRTPPAPRGRAKTSPPSLVLPGGGRLYLLRRNRQAVSGALSHHQPASEKEHQEAARPQRRLWCAGPPRRHATGDPPSGFWRPLYRKYPLPRDDTPAAASARAAQAIPSQPYPTRRTRPGGIRCLRDQKDTCMTDTQRLTD